MKNDTNTNSDIKIDKFFIDSELSTARVLFDKVSNSNTHLNERNLSIFQQNKATESIKEINNEIDRYIAELKRIEKRIAELENEYLSSEDVDGSIEQLEAINSLLLKKRRTKSQIKVLKRKAANFQDMLREGLEDVANPSSFNISYTLKERRDVEEKLNELIFKNRRLKDNLVTIRKKVKEAEKSLIIDNKKLNKIEQEYKIFLREKSNNISPDGKIFLEEIKKLKNKRTKLEDVFFKAENKFINEEIIIRDEESIALKQLDKKKDYFDEIAQDINVNIQEHINKANAVRQTIRDKREDTERQNQKLEKSAGGLQISFDHEKEVLTNEIKKIDAKIYRLEEKKRIMYDEYNVMNAASPKHIPLEDTEFIHPIREITRTVKTLKTEREMFIEDQKEIEAQNKDFLLKDSFIERVIAEKEKRISKENKAQEAKFKKQSKDLNIKLAKINSELLKIYNKRKEVEESFVKKYKVIEDKIQKNKIEITYEVENINERISVILENMKKHENFLSSKIAHFERDIEKLKFKIANTKGESKVYIGEDQSISFEISLNATDKRILEMKIREIEKRLKKADNREEASGIKYHVSEKPIDVQQLEVIELKKELTKFYNTQVKPVAENVNISIDVFRTKMELLEKWNVDAMNYIEVHGNFEMQAKSQRLM